MTPIAEEYPTDREIRETAILLLAADLALCDSMDKWEALHMASNIEESLWKNPMWSNGKHEGDCTKQPHTCNRCVIEDFEDQARKMWEL